MKHFIIEGTIEWRGCVYFLVGFFCSFSQIYMAAVLVIIKNKTPDIRNSQLWRFEALKWPKKPEKAPKRSKMPENVQLLALFFGI